MSGHKISFLGDVVLDKEYIVNIPLDSFIFNLEHPLSCDGVPAQNKVNFCSDKSYIEQTFGKLPIAVNLANNHIADYGDSAFLKTINFLEKNNIAYFGAGNTENNFNNPAIIKFEEKRIALLGYSCPSTNAIFGNTTTNGSAKLTLERVEQDICRVKEKSDYIVVNLHWGVEDLRFPKPVDVKSARKFVDLGANLIIGHHAHVIQSTEVYNGQHIFYGLGHFLFPYLERPSYHDGEQFTKVFSPKARKINREGLIVHLHKNLKTSSETIYFDDNQVLNRKAKRPKWIPTNEKAFAFFLMVRKKLVYLKYFIERPRIPSISQIKKFIGI